MRESPPTPLAGFLCWRLALSAFENICFRVHVSMNERDVKAVLFCGSSSDRAGMFLYWPVLHRGPSLPVGFVLGVGFVLVAIVIQKF